ncbi:MAG: hypothetical protein MHMPM18_003136 [Marteilia pararefringens]
MDVAMEAAFASRFDPSRDDDFCDRLLRLYSFIILVAFGAILGSGAYFGVPIACAVSPEYSTTSHATSYIENFCFLTSTYAVTSVEEKPEQIFTAERNISYYQWAPLIIGISLILLLVPNFVWRSLAPSYRKFPEISRSFNFILEPKQQEKLVVRASLVIRNVITNSNSPHQLAAVFIFIKFFILFILILELLLFQFTLGPYNVLTFLSPKAALRAQNIRFPLNTQCSTKIYAQSLDNLVTISARCVLPNNILLFYFVVFCVYWFSFLFLVSLFNLIYWCVVLLNHGMRCRYILRRLYCHTDPKDLSKFVDALGIDGIFMIHMTSKNGSDLFASMLTDYMYKIFLQSKFDIEE